MKKVILLIFLQLLFVVGCFSQVKQYVIEHPGAAGLNTYYGDAYVNPNEARALTNFDIVDGDLVRRPGYIKIFNGSDTLSDGLGVYYDVNNEGRLLLVSYDTSNTDTGRVYYSNPNTFTFSADSFIATYQYIIPPHGYDWVQFEDAVFGVSGKAHPIIYQKEQSGILSIPAPGAVTVAVMNKASNPKGTYSYKLHFFADSAASGLGGKPDTAKRSYPGPASAYVFPDNEAVILSGFPGCIGADGLGDSARIMLTRNKNGSSDYYYVDTFTIAYGAVADFTYIDTMADDDLGPVIYMEDTAWTACCEDSIMVPGELLIIQVPWATVAWDGSTLGDSARSDTFHFAYSYIDTLLGIESEIGYWSEKASAIGDSGRLTAHMYIQTLTNNFIDGTVIYCTYDTSRGVDNSDSTTYRVFDTTFGPWDDVHRTFHEHCPYGQLIDSTIFFARTTLLPFMITNKIPYKYMVHSFSRLWGAGDVDFPSRLYYSGRTDTGAIGYWDMTFNYLALDENDGGRIMGMVAVEGGLVVYKGYSAWFVTGTDPEYDMRVIKISSDIGTVSNNSIAQYNGKDYFMTPDLRVMERTGNQFKEISRKIWDNWNTLSDTILININATVYKGEYWLSFCTDELHGTQAYYNKDIYICDLTSGQYSWRKYSFEATNFTSYDTVSSKDYVREQTLIFTDKGSDDIFYFNHNDTCTIDAGSQFGCDYISAPFLRDGTYKILGGRIEVDMATNDTLLVRLLDIGQNIISAVTLYNHGLQINDVYEFAFAGVAGSGFHFEVYDATAGTATLKVKRIELDYMEYDK